MTPTVLSLRLLRAEGWFADVAERWVPAGAGGIRRDLFGMLDIVALRGPATLGVQTTSAANVAARLAKLGDDEHRPQLEALRAAGWRIVVHGWRKTDRHGRACKHVDHCACRWTLHRCEELTA